MTVQYPGKGVESSVNSSGVKKDNSGVGVTLGVRCGRGVFVSVGVEVGVLVGVVVYVLVGVNVKCGV